MTKESPDKLHSFSYFSQLMILSANTTELPLAFEIEVRLRARLDLKRVGGPFPKWIFYHSTRVVSSFLLLSFRLNRICEWWLFFERGDYFTNRICLTNDFFLWLGNPLNWKLKRTSDLKLNWNSLLDENWDRWTDLMCTRPAAYRMKSFVSLVIMTNWTLNWKWPQQQLPINSIALMVWES